MVRTLDPRVRRVVDTLKAAVPRAVVVDIETLGMPWEGLSNLLVVGLYDFETKEALAYAAPDIPAWVWNLLESETVPKVEHTLYDATWLTLAGKPVNGPIVDTRVMAWNLDEAQDFRLDALVRRYVGKSLDKRLSQKAKTVMFRCDDGEIVSLGNAPKEQVVEYCRRDVEATAQLFLALREEQPEYWEDQIELTGVLKGMECAGIPVDLALLERSRVDTRARVASLTTELKAGLPDQFNLDSGDQVAAYLFLDKFRLPARHHQAEEADAVRRGFVVTRRGRLYSHGHYEVEGLRLPLPSKQGWTASQTRPRVDFATLSAKYSYHPWVAKYLEYTAAKKLLTTYLEPLDRYIHDGRVYGHFNQAGTVSGRLSSSEPNMQNFPRRGGSSFRSIFRGGFVVADFSQLEPRLMAHCSGDPTFIDIYRNNEDVYKRVGSYVFSCPEAEVDREKRDVAKTLVLSMGYGAMPRKVAEILSVSGYTTTVAEAKRYLEAVREMFPVYFDWREKVIEAAYERGWVETVSGRRCHVNMGSIEQAWRGHRQAVNRVIQGSAADVMNGTMLAVAKMPGVRILAQVHDELLMEKTPDFSEGCVRDIQTAGELQATRFSLAVPLVFEPKEVESWADK